MRVLQGGKSGTVLGYNDLEGGGLLWTSRIKRWKVATQDNRVSWEEAFRSYEALEAEIRNRFEFNPSKWINNLRVLCGRLPLWWDSSSEERTVNKYCQEIHDRLIGAVLGGRDFNGYNLLSDSDCFRFHWSCSWLLKEILASSGMKCWRVESLLIREIRFLKSNPKMARNEWKIFSSDSLRPVPVFSKNLLFEPLQEVGEKAEVKKREKAQGGYRRPVHAYPEVGTALWVNGTKGDYIRTEVIRGADVGDKRHDRVILILSGDYTGYYSRHPSPVVAIITGVSHPSGWTMMFKDGVNYESPWSAALIKSGNCRKIGKVVETRPSALYESLPQIKQPLAWELSQLEGKKRLEYFLPSSLKKEKTEEAKIEEVGVEEKKEVKMSSPVEEGVSLLFKVKEKQRELTELFHSGKIPLSEMSAKLAMMEVKISKLKELEDLEEKIAKDKEQIECHLKSLVG